MSAYTSSIYRLIRNDDNEVVKYAVRADVRVGRSRGRIYVVPDTREEVVLGGLERELAHLITRYLVRALVRQQPEPSLDELVESCKATLAKAATSPKRTKNVIKQPRCPNAPPRKRRTRFKLATFARTDEECFPNRPAPAVKFELVE